MEKELQRKFGQDYIIGSGEQLNLGVSKVIPPLSWELYRVGKESNLPSEISSNKKLIEKASFRTNLHDLFDRVFQAVPDPTLNINQAVEKDLIEGSIVGKLWDRISDFLEQDTNNSRILLYLPFEILPDLKHKSATFSKIAHSSERFVSLYKQGWIKLLHETESRANFVDGDVLEPKMGKSERISKAGHLIPELIYKGIVSIEEAKTILCSISDHELSKSLAEGIIVANDRNLIDGSEWMKLQQIINEKFGSIYFLSKKENRLKDPKLPRISPERAKWLKAVEKEKDNEEKAELLSEKLISELGLDELNTSNESQKVKAMAVVKTGTRLSQVDLDKAKDFAHKAEQYLLRQWELYKPNIQDAIIGGLNRWARIDIIDTAFLHKFGIKLTDLSLPTQYDEKESSEVFKDFLKASAEIQKHPILSKNLYPGFLIFGSKLKGYADVDADIDAAIFFRPQVNYLQKEEVLEILKKDIPGLANIDKFMEFWVKEKNGNFYLDKPRQDNRIFLGEQQVHFLLGGVWIGGGDEFTQLRSEILKSYLDLSRFHEQKKEVRSQLLGQIELDVLQYRLMHKGYKKLYPQIKRQNTPNSGLIDWDSDFWDPGFRRIATKLFISKVFLPDLA